MKGAKRNLVVAVVFMLGTLFNYANVNKPTKKTKFVKVTFENVEKGQSLIIKDKQGVILHKENISKNGELVKFFDFSSLKDGNYKIEVNKNYEILVKNFKVKNNQVTFIETTENIVFKPVIKTKDYKVLVSRINFDKSPLNIIIYFNETVIVKETVTCKENLINKVYKLDASEKGDYKVVILSNNKSYIKDFSL